MSTRNDGFTLVEVLVRAVTGKSFAAYVQASILDPLNFQALCLTTPFPKDRYAGLPVWRAATQGLLALRHRAVSIRLNRSLPRLRVFSSTRSVRYETPDQQLLCGGNGN